MSKVTQNNTVREVIVSSDTISISPIVFSSVRQLQTISLLSPISEPGAKGQNTQYRTLLTINTYPYTQVSHGDLKSTDAHYDQDYSIVIDRDVFNNPPDTHEQNTTKFPPMPTYNESQRAYYPHGVKRLPYFHPQKFSKRLRTLMDKRRRPQPLMLDLDCKPQPKSYFSPSPTPCQTSQSTDSIFQSILRLLPKTNAYDELDQEEYNHYHVERCDLLRRLDRKALIIVIVGMLLAALALGAWVMATIAA
ncbi:hypothetical protein BDZ91DRAFT_852313 [Kalaharituber pfeilii]|nr:hypothetical protein BDZ91DRAFT_852313 [Kalaharituber pfeilii]